MTTSLPITSQFTDKVIPVNDFVHYQSKDQLINFSIIFPANWKYRWNTGSRFWVFEISSGDFNMSIDPKNQEADLRMHLYSLRNSGPAHITGTRLADEPLIKNWKNDTASVIEYLAPTKINGQEAAKVIFISSFNRIITDVLITDGSLVLIVSSSVPIENQEELLPIVDKIINSIELIPNLDQ